MIACLPKGTATAKHRTLSHNYAFDSAIPDRPAVPGSLLAMAPPND